jgi:WD40 repeat protein
MRTRHALLGLLSFVVLLSPTSAQGPAARTDAQGDPLPPGAIARLGTVRLRHGRPIRAVAFVPGSGEGATPVLVSGSEDYTIRFWDLSSGKETRRFTGHEEAVADLAFTPDGKVLVSVGWDHTARIWDMATGKLLHTIGDAYGQVHAVAVSPDGKTIAWGSEDRIVRVGDLKEGKEILSLPGHGNPIRDLAFSPDGKMLASCSADHAVFLWDPATGKLLRRLTGHTSSLVAVAFTPDGKLLSAGNDSTLRLWDPATGKELKQAKSPKVPTAFALAPDGKSVAWADVVGGLHTWDLTTGKVAANVAKSPVRIHSLAYSPDGKLLVGGGEEASLAVFDMPAGKQRRYTDGHPGWVKSLAVSPDGSKLYSGGTDGTYRVWDLKTYKLLDTHKASDAPGHGVTLALSADGKRLVTASGRNVRVWETATGKQLRRLGSTTTTTSWFTPVVFSPDGKYLASSGGTTVYLWDVATGRAVRTFRPVSQWANSLAFSPDGKYLAIGRADKSLRLWEVGTGRMVREFKGHTRNIASLAFSPDGKMLASWSGDRSAIVWEVATGKERRRFYVGFRSGVIGYMPLTFSPDGKLLAAGCQDYTARVWEVATGKEVARLAGHQGWVRGIAFTPDGDRLITGAQDTSILVWDLREARKKATGLGAPVDAGDAGACWEDLAGEDAAGAYRALCLLAGSPKVALPLVREKLLKDLVTADPAEITRLIRELDAEEFAVRERATAALIRLGPAARPPLETLLKGDPTPEAHFRARRILDQLEEKGPSGDGLRNLRVVEALERMGTPEAREVLEGLTRVPGLTTEARAALARMGR